MPKIIPVPEHIKGLIFDCDGTLVDSMPIHLKGWEHAITKSGGKWDYDLFVSSRGMIEKDIIYLYNEKYLTSLDANSVLDIKHSFVKNHMTTLEPIKPVVDVVLKYKDILPMSVVSGGTRENILTELEIIGLSAMFNPILTADDDFKPKPAPDLFLQAAKLMNVPPNLCVVFEDGDLGMQGAVKAGMEAIDIKEFLD